MKIWIAVYIVILLSLWRQYRKIKKNPEKYNDVEAIYQYEPRFRYLKKGSSEWRNLSNSIHYVASLVVVILGCVCAVPVSLLYYVVKKTLIPAGSIWLMSNDFDIVLIFAFSAVVFMYVIFCLFGYSKSVFWQTFVFIDAINKSKSRAMMNHLLILMGIITITFPAFYLSLYDYAYVTDEMIVNNSFFQLHEDTYAIERCKGTILQYHKNGKKDSKDRIILVQIHIILEDGDLLKLEWSTPGKMLTVERLQEHGIQLIKPDMTEEEFYSVLNWNGEDFLQFYYPELCEQYGISLEE